MSVTAIGPALDIDGPVPVTPPYGLLSIPGVRVNESNRWENGVVIDGYPEEVPVAWEPCSSGTYRTKDDTSTIPTPRFDPVGLFVPITCSALSIGDWRTFAGRASTVLEATLSYGVEMVLAKGVVGSTNPFLGDGNVTILNAGAATTAYAGLRFLENAIGATGRGGMLHASNAVASAWSDYLTEQNGALYTFNGTPVAVGGGYADVTTDGNDPNDGTDYAFATGPVQVRVSDVTLVGDDINGTLDTSNNDVTFRAERYILAGWDGALQSAVLIDWTCDECPTVQ